MSKKVVLVVVLVVVTVVIIAKAVSANPTRQELRNGIALIEGRGDIAISHLNNHAIYGELGTIIRRGISSDILPEISLIHRGSGSIYDLDLA